MDAVQALVDKSLVRPWGPDRFDLLVSVQEYAAEKLEALGNRRETEVRHAAFFAPFGTPEALAALDVHGGVARRKALGVELDNLTAACGRAVQRGDAGAALPLLRAAAAVLARRGPFDAGIALATPVGSLDLPPTERESLDATIGHLLALSGRADEGRRHLEAALASATGRADPIAIGRHLTALSYVAITERRLDEARAHLEAALDRLGACDRRQVGDVLGRAMILLGNVLFAQGRPVEEALRQWQLSLELAREIGHRIAEGDAQSNLANGYARAARFAEARASYEAGLAVQREVGSRASEAITLGHLGMLDRAAGRLSEALARFEAAIAIRRELGNPAHVAESMILRAGALTDLDRAADARAAYLAAIRLLEETRAPAQLAMARINLGLLEQLDGRPAEARAHFEEAVRLNAATGNRSNEGLSRVGLGLVDQAEGKLTDARSQVETALALARETDWVVAEGEALGFLGDLAHVEGRHDDARAAFDAAEPLIRANRAPESGRRATRAGRPQPSRCP